MDLFGSFILLVAGRRTFTRYKVSSSSLFLFSCLEVSKASFVIIQIMCDVDILILFMFYFMYNIYNIYKAWRFGVQCDWQTMSDPVSIFHINTSESLNGQLMNWCFREWTLYRVLSVTIYMEQCWHTAQVKNLDYEIPLTIIIRGISFSSVRGGSYWARTLVCTSARMSRYLLYRMSVLGLELLLLSFCTSMS